MPHSRTVIGEPRHRQVPTSAPAIEALPPSVEPAAAAPATDPQRKSLLRVDRIFGRDKQFDTTGVREFHLVNNTDSVYQEITSFAYPKGGETDSACRVGVVNADEGATRWFRPNDDPGNHYIPRMEWSHDSR